MSRIAAVGDPHRIQLLEVAGVDAHPAASDGDVLAAWRELPDDVVVLILTPEAARALGSRVAERRNLLVTEMP